MTDVDETLALTSWVYIQCKGCDDAKSTRWYCTMCPLDKTGRLQTKAQSGSGYTNLHSHANSIHKDWRTKIVTDEHKRAYERFRDVTVAKYLEEDAKKRQRTDTAGEGPEPKRSFNNHRPNRSLHQKTLEFNNKLEHCSVDSLALMFCTAPIPFRFLEASSPFRKCFNTNVTDVDLKKYIVDRGQELLPGQGEGELPDASGFCDLGTVGKIPFFDIGVHDPNTKQAKTFNVDLMQEKHNSANLRNHMESFFKDCERLKVDIIAVTADNAGNMQTMMDENSDLIKCCAEAALVFKEQAAFLLPCWPHTTQLTAHDVEKISPFKEIGRPQRYMSKYISPKKYIYQIYIYQTYIFKNYASE